MTKTRWEVAKGNKGLEEIFVKELGINPIVSRILINRNITDISLAEKFLGTSLDNVHNPFQMKDMDLAVKRITDGILKKEKIFIFGDYDVDGISATALLVTFLKELNADIEFLIPDRLNDGYGLNIELIHKIKGKGGDLIITVDCGITGYDEVEAANGLGLDVIITDHHQVPDKLPRAYAIINAFQAGCNYPFKYLSGVGIAFKLVMALRFYMRKNSLNTNPLPNIKRHLDLFTLGCVADIVPLLDENRVLVKHGLIEIANTKKEGIKALKDLGPMKDKELVTDDIGFFMAPRLNAAGRLEDASICVDLLLSSCRDEAVKIAKHLDLTNKKRQKLQGTIFNEIISSLEDTGELRERKAIILESTDWHLGVLGIVASKLVDRFYVPTLLINMENGIGKASCRTIEGFHLYENLKKCQDLLENFGGHKYAAGFTIKMENLEKFKSRFFEITSKLKKEELIPLLNIDSEVSIDEIDFDMAKDIAMLGPFGNANPEPLFCCKDIQPLNITTVGKNSEHIKFKFKKCGSDYIDCIGFNMANLMDEYIAYTTHDIIFTPKLNLWNGNRYLQLHIKDSRYRC